MPGHLSRHLAQERHVPGILVLNPDLGMGRIIEELALAMLIADDDTYRDLIVYLPLPSTADSQRDWRRLYWQAGQSMQGPWGGAIRVGDRA